jgi:geranylgeranyl diphosphate synthase type I
MTDTAGTPGLEWLRRRYGDALDAEIEGWLEGLGYPRQFPGMLRYQMGYVDERLRPASHPGKRIRPFLCLAVAEALSSSFSPALPVAAGIELLHNFSLIHDDIEDRDPSRHHRPTVWKVWGEPQAINAGDAMFAIAGRAVADTADVEVAGLLIQRFHETALELTKGQYLDMSFEDRHEVILDEYMQMISLKSAVLIAYSAWAGAVVAGASERQRALLFDFGDNLGRAFQIHDDMNGIWGDERRTGKMPHTDLANRKKTFPVLSAFAAAAPQDLDALRRYFTRETDDITSLLEILERSGAHEASQQALDSYLERALGDLTEAALPSPFESELAALARQVTGQRAPAT